MGAFEFFVFFAWCFWKYQSGYMDGLGDFISTGLWFSVGLLIGNILIYTFNRR